MDEESSDEPLELPPREDDPPASEPEYGDEPFTVFEGNIFDVVSEYLKSKPHYRLVNGCIEELKTKRKTCYLECRRTVSSRNEGREASKGANSNCQARLAALACLHLSSEEDQGSAKWTLMSYVSTARSYGHQ